MKLERGEETRAPARDKKGRGIMVCDGRGKRVMGVDSV